MVGRRRTQRSHRQGLEYSRDPTSYVLDQHGIIRAKQVHHEALGEIVDRLVGEVK